MRYAIDTEFIERGREHPIILISIGIVCEDGRKYYAVSSEFKDDDCSDWLKCNVLPNLGEIKRSTIDQIRRSILQFVRDDPEFWAYFADYDWVVFCQIFGSMVDLPSGYPYYCHDLKQEIDRLGLSISQDDSVHSALGDAEWVMTTLKKIN